MNRRAMPASLRILATLIALLLTACNGASGDQPVGPSPDGVDLRGSAVGGDFTLTSDEGARVSWSDFAGRYRLIYFGFTYCPDICPTDVQRFSQGLQQFERSHPDLGAKVQPIFVSVDPERDTPEVVGQFVGNFHPRLVGLTGTPDEIRTVLTLFKATGDKLPPGPDGNYNMQHTTLTYLFDPAGKPLGIIPTDKGADGVEGELARWVR